MRATSGSVVLLQLGSMVMPMASDTTKVIGWFYPMLDTATGKLAQPLREEIDHTWERWPHPSPQMCTSLGQYTGPDAVVRGAGEKTLRIWEQKS